MQTLTVTTAFLPFEHDRDTRGYGRSTENTLPPLPLPPATLTDFWVDAVPVEEQYSPSRERRESSMDSRRRSSTSYSFDVEGIDADSYLSHGGQGHGGDSSEDDLREVDSALAVAIGGKDRGSANIEDEFVRRASLSSTATGRASSPLQRWRGFAEFLDKWLGRLSVLFDRVEDQTGEDYAQQLTTQISELQKSSKNWLSEHRNDDILCDPCNSHNDSSNYTGELTADEICKECREKLIRTRQRCARLRQHCYYYQRLAIAYKFTASV
eukprot:gb/GECG01006323.1/.p1 GENE.gb/GECG01006323.1/~~gb/GECG01006323.1/.p1  ORF type:complete len:268 (+),score=39.23 gb/GECG01006323.1/:1-804(+)